jgi:hypothetical protein
MARRAAYIVLAGLLGAECVLSREASAQDAGGPPTGPAIGASELYQPDRGQMELAADGGGFMFVPADSTSLRPANLNPYAVNYTDCTGDLYLFFQGVSLERFAGSPDSAQVWVSVGDQSCWLDAQRANGACWPALPDQDKYPGASASFLSNPIKVQDIIGPQQTPYTPPPGVTPPPPRPYAKQTGAACATQCSYTHEVFFLYFLPIMSTGAIDPNGVPYEYQLDVDLVGPPPPTLESVGIGDGLLVANWSANADGETAGYNIYIDPFPGTEGPSPAVCGASSSQPAPDASSTSGGSVTGNACYDQNLAGSVPGIPPMCSQSSSSVDASTGDASGNVAGEGGASDGGDAGDGGATADAGSDGGASTEAGEDAAGDDGGDGSASDDGGDGAAEVDSSTPVVDSGTAVDSGEGGTEPGTGGIALLSTSNDPTKYLLNASGGMTVTGESTGSYTITGLKNCTNYVFVVSAVDSYGNVGPPSSATPQDGCAWPQSAGDFWQSYRGDGGQAGGYCALEAVGRSPHSLAALALIAGGVAVAASRRRRAR